MFFVFTEWGRSPIYRRWEVRGLGCEGVVEEMASTINVQNAATFMNPRLKLLKLHPFPPHNMQRSEFLEEMWLLERFPQICGGWVVRVRKLSIFPFSIMQ